MLEERTEIASIALAAQLKAWCRGCPPMVTNNW